MSEFRDHLRGLCLVGGVLAVMLPAAAVHGQTTVVSVSGLEQRSGAGTWDGGSLTVTVNGHSETASFGQFSSAQSVASALAAKFTTDCHSPVKAKAVGLTITFVSKDSSDPMVQLSAEAVWDTADFSHSSFGIAQPHNGGAPPSPPTLLTPSLSLSCTPDPVPLGGSVDCTAELPPGATGSVSFAADGQTAWTTALVDAGGWAPASTLAGLQTGSHSIVASYTGDSVYNATSQTLLLPVEGTALVTADVYCFSISQPVGSGCNPSPVGGYAANSNILAYTDSVNGQWSFGYDSLNRLTGGSAMPVSGSGAMNWCWSYDAFGNRTREVTAGVPFTDASCDTIQSPAPLPLPYNAHNQTTTAFPVYDPSGSGLVLSDGMTSYSYDGEGRVCAVSSGGFSYQYVYDADGNRVAKGLIQLVTVNGQPALSCDMTVNSFTVMTSYVLGQDGEQVTEMRLASGQTSWSHTNVFAGGMLLATYDPQGLHFQITDWLGSRRVQTNAFGQTEETCTNSPFGNNLNCSFPNTAPTTADAEEDGSILRTY